MSQDCKHYSTKHCKDSYADFLLSEYNNIAAAHFNAREQVAVFFKHYLWIMSLPLVAVMLSAKSDRVLLFEYDKILQIAPFLFLVISLIGVFFLLQIAHLSATVTLYARQVNGIRRFFTLSAQQAKIETALSVLPVDPNRPSPIGQRILDHSMVCCCLINSLYIVLFCYFYFDSTVIWHLVVVFTASFILQHEASKRYIIEQYNKYTVVDI